MAQPIYLDPELQGIERQRQLAQALMQRGMQAPQGQMVSGRFVAPSVTQYLANAFDAYSGKSGVEQAEQKAGQFQQRQQQASSQNIADALRLSQGGEKTVYGAGMEGPTMEVQQVAPDMNAAISKLLRPNASATEANLGNALLKQQFETPKKTNDIANYEYDVKNSGFKGTFNDWLTSQKRAGATNVSVGGAKDLAGQVGDISKESKIAAMGAVQSADAANRIIQAVDSNKLFSGVGANQRLTLAQLADGLGVGGKDTAEKIANSRQAIQGLAQLTLQGRKQMRGEGAITESEGLLAQRAMSGEITLTGAEIRQLAEAAKRAAKFQYSQHQNIINTMKSRPDTKDLVPFYDVPADVNIFAPRVVGGQSNIRNEADAIIGGGRR
jgi:hypothetical protein